MKLTAELGERSYDIIIKNGALGRAGQVCNLRRKVLIVSDTGVPEKLAKILQQQCGEGHLLVVEQGENSKSTAVWQTILSRLHTLGFGRRDAVAAVGGGVVGDLAGFAAAAYMRGIGFIQCPTTTLAQVDSSIGGKVALNLDGTKNLIGAFYQPEAVIVDPATLATLPRRHWANGLAEALKMSLTGNADLFHLMETDDIDANLEQILYLSLLYKKEIVQRDETEQGERKLLNFGHTIGHGIEAACGLENREDGLLHGEAIALGMLPMITSSALRRRTLAVMEKLGLPLSFGYDADAVLQHMQSDKKREGATYTIARVKQAGKGYLEQVTFNELSRLAKENTA